MKWIDEKFRKNKVRYVLQCLLATLAVMVILLLLDALEATAIIASLGATSFIAFTMPHADSCRPRFLLGGYATGILAGSCCKLMWMQSILIGVPFFKDHGNVVFGALAVGLAIFLMVLLNFEHPPACGLALGVVLNEFSLRTILIVAIGVVGITVLKTVMKPLLKNLL